MDTLQALVLGVVEGVTEFLPVSSTGHLILASKLMAIPESDFLKSFEVAIQLGAILAALLLYWRSLLLSPQILLRVCVAFLPTAVIGLLLHGFIKRVLLGSDVVVLWSLLIGGIALIVFEQWYGPRQASHSHLKSISLKTAFLIGVGQSLALLPGVSRSAATIVSGLLLGMDRKSTVEFSFLLAIPTMAAATGLDLLSSETGFSASEWTMLSVGFVAAFLVALVAIRWLIRYVSHHTFTPFGIYRIAAAALYALFILR